MGKRNPLSTYMGNLIYEQYKEDIEAAYINAYDDMVYDIYEDAFQLYAKAIDQYYLYETTSYIRHGEGKPGTKKGTNLHEANLTYLKRNHSSGRLYNGVVLHWDSVNMLPYKRVKTDYVLSNVLNGIRGVPVDNSSLNSTGNFFITNAFSSKWEASVKLPNTRMALRGTPNEMLRMFLSNSTRRCNDLMREKLKNRRNLLIQKITGGKSWQRLR